VTGVDHPDVIVETATLASVTPPDPTYTVHKGVKVRVLCVCLGGGGVDGGEYGFALGVGESVVQSDHGCGHLRTSWWN